MKQPFNQIQLNMEPNERIVIEFDGGTSSNIPRLGYGIGYGSFKIRDSPVEKVDHGAPMSANVAEIMTIVVALDKLRYANGPCHVLARGDSMITVNWINKIGRKVKDDRADSFRIAVDQLKSACRRHLSVKAEWRGRAHSVKMFGH